MRRLLTTGYLLRLFTRAIFRNYLLKGALLARAEMAKAGLVHCTGVRAWSKDSKGPALMMGQGRARQGVTPLGTGASGRRLP